jgi:hypothetical protein
MISLLRVIDGRLLFLSDNFHFKTPRGGIYCSRSCPPSLGRQRWNGARRIYAVIRGNPGWRARSRRERESADDSALRPGQTFDLLLLNLATRQTCMPDPHLLKSGGEPPQLSKQPEPRSVDAAQQVEARPASDPTALATLIARPVMVPGSTGRPRRRERTVSQLQRPPDLGLTLGNSGERDSSSAERSDRADACLARKGQSSLLRRGEEKSSSAK